MWDLIKAILNTLFSIFEVIMKLLWNIIEFLLNIISYLVLIASKAVILYFYIIADLIRKFPLSFIISIIILGIGCWAVQRNQRERGITNPPLLQNPKFLCILLIPITTILIGFVAESGPISIVNKTTNVVFSDWSVRDSSSVHIVFNDNNGGGFLGIPTEVWSALISLLAAIFSAYISTKKQ